MLLWLVAGLLVDAVEVVGPGDGVVGGRASVIVDQCAGDPLEVFLE
jgi:hypothetical protein